MVSTNDLFEVSANYWLIVLALSLCVTLAYFWRLGSRKPDGTEKWHRVTAFAAAIIWCLTAVDGLNFAQHGLGAYYRVSGSIAVIALTAGLTWLHLSHARLPRSVFRRRLSGWIVVLSSVIVSGWSYHRFQVRLNPPPKRAPLLIRTPGKKQLIHEFVAMTDRNRPIRVFRMSEDGVDVANDESNSLVYTVESMIQRSPSSSVANCHGWVFLDSQFLIPGEAVQQILDDNGYELVTEPKAGDVIIYRDDNRSIVHSGLVRGVLNDDTIIIESKWGTEGVFLHDPDGTPYSTLHEYFRSPRTDNRVKIVPVDELSIDD